MYSSGDIELSIVAVHPFTGKHIPVFVAPFRDYGEHLIALLGIPSCSDEDRQFAVQHKLSFTDVYDADKRVIINSDSFSGLTISEALSAICNHAKELQCGGHVTSERARDWLISRQRYWGTPIPIIHCHKYGAVPVPYEDLPVTLPELTQFRGYGVSPLAAAGEHWLKVKCPKCDCGGFGRRETDTMDTFVNSSWYYLRYLDPKNTCEPVSKDAAQLMPVDLYIGGKEHAILHLYYARFFNHFLHDIGMVPCREPFVNLLTQGMVMGRSYKLKDTGKYLRPQDVDLSGKVPVQRGTGGALIVDWEKMSKSKFNGIDPEDVLNEYGTDSTRLCILANVAPKSDRPWSDDVFTGVLRWQGRIWTLLSEFITAKTAADALKSSQKSSLSQPQLQQVERDIFTARNFTLKEVLFHMNKTFLLNTAISRLQSLTNLMKKVPAEAVVCSQQYERLLAELIIMISPFAPMFACELWAGLASAPGKTTQFDWNQLVLEQRWPTLDLDYHLPMSINVNGKEAYSVELPMPHPETHTLTLDMALSLAEQDIDNYRQAVGSQPVLSHKLTFDPRSLRVDIDLTVADRSKTKSHDKAK